MTKPTSSQKRPSGLLPRNGFTLLAILLLIVVGTISFVSADGLTILYRSGMSLITPRLQFVVRPENTIIPADGITQIYIDAQLKNTKGQLLDGTNISVRVLAGQADITKAPAAPADVSQRILLRAPNQPQLITLEFTYKHLTKNLGIEAFDPTVPVPPTVTAPANGTVFTTATPAVSGQAPLGTQVEIYLDAGLNSTLDVNQNGNFAGNLQTAVKRGKHKLTATAINKYGNRSLASPAINIDIQTPDPEIDLLNLRIKPNPVKSGTTFRIFIPVSVNTKAVELSLDNARYSLQDANKSSVFSGVIPAPKNPGLYRLSLIIITETGESILAEKVASIQVN